MNYTHNHLSLLAFASLCSLNAIAQSCPPLFDATNNDVIQETVIINFISDPDVFRFEEQSHTLVSYPADIAHREPLPVISWMHGNGYDGFDYEDIARTLSANGYIVIATSTGNNSGSSVDAVRRRTAYHQEVGYTYLLEQNQTPESVFFGKVDPDRLGLVGHSWGGTTTEFNMFRMPEADAFVMIEPVSMFINVSEWEQKVNIPFSTQSSPFPDKPVMYVKGAGRPNVFWGGSALFHGGFQGTRLHLTIEEAWHESFTDPDSMPNINLSLPPELAQKTNKAVSHYIIAFFEAYLNQNPKGMRALYAPNANEAVRVFGVDSMISGLDINSDIIEVADFTGTTPLQTAQGGTISASGNNAQSLQISPPLVVDRIEFSTVPAFQPTVNYFSMPTFNTLKVFAPAANGKLDISIPLTTTGTDVSEATHVVLAISQVDANEQNIVASPATASIINNPPLELSLTDTHGHQVTASLADSFPSAGFVSPFLHDLRVPLSTFEQIDLEKVINLQLVVSPQQADVFFEIDRIFFAKLPRSNEYDLNDSGRVDKDDITLLLDAIQQNIIEIDINNDAAIDFLDLALHLRRFALCD